MKRLPGDAAEEFFETLNAKTDQEVDNELVYEMPNVMAECGTSEVRVILQYLLEN